MFVVTHFPLFSTNVLVVAKLFTGNEVRTCRLPKKVGLISNPNVKKTYSTIKNVFDYKKRWMETKRGRRTSVDGEQAWTENKRGFLKKWL